MKPWSQDFLCEDGHRFNEIVDKSEKDLPRPCQSEGCKLEAKPTFSVPRPMRAAFHDGVRRRGFREGVLASELESAAFDKPVGSTERKELLQEVKTLRKADT
jgi:hypothetical protein